MARVGSAIHTETVSGTTYIVVAATVGDLATCRVYETKIVARLAAQKSTAVRENVFVRPLGVKNQSRMKGVF